MVTWFEILVDHFERKEWAVVWFLVLTAPLSIPMFQFMDYMDGEPRRAKPRRSR